MWFWFTLCTILCWSGSDLFSKLGSKSDDRYSHWKMTTAVGLVMGIHAIVQVVSGVEFHFGDILTYLPVSAMYILSMVLGYAGLRYIMLSVSSPICNSSGAITAILCFFVLGQRMTPLQYCAVALICLGIFGLSVLEKRSSDAQLRAEGEQPDRKYRVGFLAILFPILYCIIDGLGSFADAYYLEYVIDELQANIAYEFTFLIVGALAAIYVFAIRREKFTFRREKFKLTGAVFETAGQFTYVFALSGNAIVAAPIIASYSVFSVLWSRIFLKEKLTWAHYAIILAVMVGIAILGIE